MASICCSPPRERAGDLLLALLQARKGVEDQFEFLLDDGLSRCKVRAHHQVFVHGEVGEHHAPLGHVRKAELHDLVRGQTGDVLAVVEDLPARGFTRPEMARSVVLLPAPFAPMSVTMLPAGTDNEMPCSALMAP